MRTLTALSCLAGAFLAAAASPASAAWNPNWIACDGQTVTTGTLDGKPINETKPGHHVFGYDDASKNIYLYSDARKSADPEPVTSYSDSEIKWGSHRMMGQSTGADWDARLDRKTMDLTLNYQEAGTQILWNEKCVPTASPLESAKSAQAKTDAGQHS